MFCKFPCEPESLYNLSLCILRLKCFNQTAFAFDWENGASLSVVGTLHWHSGLG